MTQGDHTKLYGQIPISSLYTAGIAGEVFLRTLKEKGRFIGTVCRNCDFTYVPARLFCERCFSELKEYKLVSNKGKLLSYTICNVDLDGKSLQESIIVGLLKLEDASTCLIHKINARQSVLNIGLQVRAVFEPKKKRKGSILDVRYFVPA